MPTIPSSLPKINVEKITPVRKGNLAAFATVTINDKIRITSVRVIDQPGKKAWVSMPQNEVAPIRTNEKRKFYSIVEILDAGLKDAICGAVLRAYNAQSQPAHQTPVRASIPPFSKYQTHDQDVSF